MRYFKFYFSSAVLLVLMCASIGCSDDDPVVVPDLNLKNDLVEVVAEGGMVTIDYQLTNPVEGASVKIKNEAAWLSDFKVLDNQISFRVAANTEESAREVKLTLTYSRLEEVFFVTVRQSGAASLVVEKTEVEVSAEGGRQEIACTVKNPISGVKVEAECVANWIEKLETTDKGVTFVVSANSLFEVREAEIKVVYGKSLPVCILVKQSAINAPVLTLDRNLVEMTAEGGHASVAYRLENPSEDVVVVKVTVADTWVENLTASTDVIIFDVIRNTEMIPRETIIKVEYPNVEPQQIMVKQAAALQPVITINPAKVEFPAEGGRGEVCYTIQNSIEGEIVSVASEAQWIEQLQADERMIVFTVGENTTPEVRTALIKVNYKNAQEVLLEVGQVAGQSNEMTVEANGVKFKMICVHGGTFQMGATDEQYSAVSDEYPAHEVTLSEYFMGQYEVTQELWQAVMGSNPSTHTNNPQFPVEMVSWNDCQLFIAELNKITGLNFSLPTEAQWEYAARGGEFARGLLFSGSDFSEEVAWFDTNSSYETHPVGQLKPNELGLYDMSGNVYEWCSDFYGDYSETPQIDPTGLADGWGRILRGGCYYEWGEDKLRISSRHMDAPDVCDDGYGLRLVLSK